MTICKFFLVAIHVIHVIRPLTLLFSLCVHPGNQHVSMVTGMRLVAVAAVANCCAAATYSNFEFDISAVRDTSASIVQLSEFRLYDTDGVEIAIASASNTDVNNPCGEGADNAIDGSTSTKWLHFNEGDLVLALTLPSEIGSYSWATANDEEGRDPVMWTLLGYDDDASTWMTLDDIYSSSSFFPTFLRYTWVGTFDIPPTPTSTPTSTSTPEPTSAPTFTPTPVPTSTPTASASTSTPTRSPVPTPAPTSAAPSTTSPTLAPSTKSIRAVYEVCAPPAGAAGCWCDGDEAYYGLGAETRVSLAQTYVAPRASLRFSFVFIACCACSSLFIDRLSTESFWRPRSGAAGEIKMSRPRYVELPSVSAVREARLRLEHVFALGPPTSFGSAPPEIPASELFAAVPHTDAPSPRPTVISRALLSKGGGGDGGGDDKRRGQKSQSSMQLTSASARGVVLVGAPPSAEAVDEVISIVGQHAAVGGAAAVSATKAASGVALACGGGAVGAVVPVCAKLPELVGTVGLKVTRNLFALYLLVTVIEAPERAEEQLARIGGASRDLVTAPSRPSGNTLRGSAPVPNLLRPLKLPIPVPSILLPPPNVPPSAPTDSLYNLFGFIDLFSVWRAVWRVGDYFEGAFELLSEKVNIDVNCPGAYSAWYPLTNSALIFALLLLFQSDLLLYCRITILKFGRGRNAVFKYAVGNFSYFAYESALVLEQLAVASWSLRLYHYGWIRKHREEAIGGLDSACNDESNGADVTLFHLVTNMVAWLMAPFQLYMLVNWGVPHNGCYRGFYGSFLFGGVAFQKRGLQGAAKIVGLRDGGPWARAAERYYDKASSGFHRGLAACTRPVARAADAYLKLGEAASTIPSRVKSMCGVWDKGHFVTMEVVADAAAFDDEDEDEDAHFEECPELARLPLLASVRTDIYAVLGWQLRRLNLGRVRPFFCATALSLRMADELSARFVSKGAIHRHRRLLLLLFICSQTGRCNHHAGIGDCCVVHML